jgi:hypothetical protein
MPARNLVQYNNRHTPSAPRRIHIFTPVWSGTHHGLQIGELRLKNPDSLVKPITKARVEGFFESNRAALCRLY